MYNVSKEKYFSTWSSKSPAIFAFLPADFHIGLGAYSHSAGAYTEFPFDIEHVRLREHDAAGKYCALELEHKGTRLLLEYFKPDDWTVRARIRRIQNGEWGLRFWAVLHAGFPKEGMVTVLDERTVQFQHRSYNIVLKLPAKTMSQCVSKDYSFLGESFEKIGYYAPLKNDPDGTWFSAAYQFEEMPEVNFSVSIANETVAAEEAAKHALEMTEKDLDTIRKDSTEEELRMTGPHGECICAIPRVMAWNGLADWKHRRVYTSLTRAWIDAKFGGWFVWLNDMFLHSLINAWGGDRQMAENNIIAAFDNLTPEGNLAALMAEFTEWVDRSQLPMASFLVWKYEQITGDTSLVEKYYETMKEEYDWWLRCRDGNNNQVLELGSSPGGNGHFGQSIMAAKDESGMDNSAIYDGAVYVPETHTMDMEDVTLNAFHCLAAEALAAFAKELGREEEAEQYMSENAREKRRVDRRLWDAEREIYANRLWSGRFASPGPQSFYTLLAGIPNKKRADRMVEHMLDETEFWTKAPMPSIWLKDPVSQEQVYFRGRMWPPLNYYTYAGLKRYRYDAEAHELARLSILAFEKSWEEEGACYENFDPFTGVGKSTDADPFYGWGALMPLMWLNEFIDVDPWNGFHFGAIGEEKVEIQNVRIKEHTYSLSCKRETVLQADGKKIFQTDARGRFRHFVYEKHYLKVEIPPQEKERRVSFPALKPVRVAINGRETAPANTIRDAFSDAMVIELWF